MSLLRETIRKVLILEKKIAEIKSNLTVTMNLRYQQVNVLGMKTHAEIQKKRDFSKSGDIIRDYDILNSVKKVKDDIVQYIVIGELYDGVEFVIKDESSLLSIAIRIEEVNPYEFNLFIKTVMRNANFYVGRNQLVITAK
jgi:hypothetical protein